MVETEVLVIGAGPVGLALTGDLGWRSRQCILVERGDGSIFQPKMDLVGPRTMEFCRRWGIVEDVQNCPYNRDYPQDNIYITALNGYELGRQPLPPMRHEKAVPESAQQRERCPQNMFDPILRRFAERQGTTTLLYKHEFRSFTQDAEGVTATVVNLTTGEESRIRARYLVGCDGGTSQVREQLGIGMTGRGVLTYTTNVIFRCPEFNSLHDQAPGYRYMFVGPDGVWATIVAINGNDQWRMSIVGDKSSRVRYTDEQIKGFAHKAMGREFDLEILSVLRWTRRELVADRYQEGRVFIAGDACHLTSPTGGLGMNTGIGDAVDLSWKLAAVLEGWGGQGLLDSYTAERRPVAVRITRFSTGNLQTMKSVRSDATLYADSEAGRATRERVGRALSEGLKREWFSTNMNLGYRYVNSNINLYTEPEDPDQIRAEDEEPSIYHQTTRPGCRAPHVWLTNGASTLDWYGIGFVLVVADENDAGAQAMASAATAAQIPLRVQANNEPAVRELYEKRYVLVRPDGHVAWRCNDMPDDIARVLATVTGKTNQEDLLK